VYVCVCVCVSGTMVNIHSEAQFNLGGTSVIKCKTDKTLEVIVIRVYSGQVHVAMV
jgi:hypothetical protein